jgi:hypothetical protein
MGPYEVFLVVAGTVLVGIPGVLMVLDGAWGLCSDLRMRARATGTVVAAERDRNGDMQLEIAFMTRAGTPERFVDILSTGRFAPKVGGSVSVRYDADDSRSARVATFIGDVFSNTLEVVFGTAGVVVYVVAVTHMT